MSAGEGGSEVEEGVVGGGIEVERGRMAAVTRYWGQWGVGRSGVCHKTAAAGVI